MQREELRAERTERLALADQRAVEQALLVNVEGHDDADRGSNNEVFAIVKNGAANAIRNVRVTGRFGGAAGEPSGSIDVMLPGETLPFIVKLLSARRIPARDIRFEVEFDDGRGTTWRRGPGLQLQRRRPAEFEFEILHV